MKRLITLLTVLCLASTPALGQWSTDSLSVGRSTLAAVTIGDYALFAGGKGVSSSLGTVDAYQISTGIWSTAALSVPRMSIGATVVGQYAIFAGGADYYTQTVFKTVDVYDSIVGPPNDPLAWSTVSLTSKRGAVAATTAGTKAIFAGGFDGNPLVASAEVDIYDSAVGPPSDPTAWSSSTSLSEPRVLICPATVGTLALFAGGTDFSQPTSKVDIYDSNTGVWSTASLSQARSLGPDSAATVGSLTFFFGGVVSAPPNLVVSDVVDVFDAQTGLWSTLTMDVGRVGHGVTAVGNQVFIAGGQLSSQATTDLVEVLDATTLSWGAPCKLSEPRTFLEAVTVSGQAMFAGGEVSIGTFSDVIDIYQPAGSVLATETSRVGSPPNPLAFLPGVTTGPLVGETWDPVIDHTTFATGAFQDFIAVTLQGPVNFTTAFGTLLILPPFEGAIEINNASGTPFAISIPDDCLLLGLNVWTQGASLIPGPGAGVELANALDLTLGNI
ncbi:MAG: hypothetical protein ACI82F_001321 [Planctomycetota bacterium]|jgi:hypothetical protein